MAFRHNPDGSLSIIDAALSEVARFGGTSPGRASILPPPPATVACLGDSITLYNSDTPTVGNTKAASQDSFNARGFLIQTCQLLRGRLHFPIEWNFGVSGETSAQILARVSSVTGLSTKPGYCTVLAGTNDLNTSPLPTAAAIEANLKAIYDTLIDAGIVVVALCIPPRAVWSNLSAPEQANSRLLQTQVNDWIQRQVYSYPRGSFYVARTDRAFADFNTSTVSPLTATTGDNLHPSAYGAFLMASNPAGESLYDVFNAVLPPANEGAYLRTNIYDATYNPTGSLFTNPQLTGTTGTAGTGASGSIASAVTVSRTAGTVFTATCSKGTPQDANGVNLVNDNGAGTTQVIALSNTAAGAATETLRARLSITAQAGDTIEVGCLVKQTSLTATVKSVILGVNDFDGVTNYNHFGNSASGIGADHEPATCTRLIMTPRFVVRPYAGSGTQAINADLLINADCSGLAGTVTGTVEILGWFVRKVTS